MEEKKDQVQQNQQQVANYDMQFAMSPVGQTIKNFEVMQRMANMYSTSTIVPASYQKNIGNCVIALDMAMRMNCNPLMIMQNLYIVHGNPSFSSKFLIATINASKKYTSLRYEFCGTQGKMDWGCRVVAFELSDRERKYPLYGQWVTMQMAKDEGWSTKAGSKWLTMPGLMLQYRAAAFWQRTYCPEISMGLMTAEEEYDKVVEDVNFVDVSADLDTKVGQVENKKESLRKKKAAAEEQMP